MTEYQLTAETEPCAVIRYSDHACIPPDMANRDYNGDAMSPGYVQWLEDGGVPDPYVPPEPVPPVPTAEQAVLFNHENRIRGFEGREPISLANFVGEVANLK